MIVTLTLNPSLDRTLEVRQLTRGAVIRAQRARLDPGGKGVNVTRALLAHDVPTVAVLPVGGPEGERLRALLVGDGIPVRAVTVGGHTRSNVAITEPDGVTTKFNEPGGPLSAAELRTIAGVVEAQAAGASWVVGCGSLPPGVPDGTYAELTARFGPVPGLRVAIDASGPALPASLAMRPDLVKPNREELAEAVGRPVGGIEDAALAAQQLRARGARGVLVSLGAEGAVLVDDDGVLAGEAPVDRPAGTVGAGDALLAGFLAAGARGPDALAEGLAWAAATVRLPAGVFPGPADLRRADVRVHRPRLPRIETPTGGHHGH